MTHKTGRIYVAIALASAILSLTACSNQGTQPLSQAFGALTAQLQAVGTPAADARSQLSPPVVGAVKQPFLLAELPVRQASASMTLFNRRGDIEDWRGADGTSVVLDHDILIATRGLGADLFAAQAPQLRSALAGASGTIQREHRYLDGENRPFSHAYTCVITASGGREAVDLIARKVATERLVETCKADKSDSKGFTNEYWIGLADGQIWQSRQWVSNALGSLLIQHLVR